MRYKFTETELKTLLDNIVIIIDKREKVYSHITDFFDKKKIKYRLDIKLDQGDYSCYIERNENTKHLLTRDLYFDKEVAIERKASISELAGNFQNTERARLQKEFALVNKNDIRIYLLLEERGLDDLEESLNGEDKTTLNVALDILKELNISLRPQGFDYNVRAGKDMGQFDKRSFYGSLQGFNAEFDLRFRPIEKKFIASEISNLLKYHISYLFKKKGFIYFEDKEGVSDE